MKMKQNVLALAGALAAFAFAQDASAIPAFARQVGMACSACHYQHFPALNSFGRSFKQSGYTMVGAQEKIEGDDISLPTVLNAALVGQIQYAKASGGTVVPAAAHTINDGQLMIPSATSLFMGGRAGEHTGFEAEYQISAGGTGSTAASSLIRLKVPFVYDVNGVKVGIIPYSTNLGAADSFELLNTGSVAVHAFNQISLTTVSAQQYLATNTAATGVAFVASNENFFANFSKWGQNLGTGTASSTSNYLRAAWTPSDLISGFDTAIGFQSWSGTSATALGVLNDTKATSIDAQLMGDVKGMPLLVTASYATAPKSGAGAAVTNLFNASTTNDRKSFNIGAELGVIPGKATVQFALRNAKSGLVVPGTATGNATDNAYLLGATYNIALNVRGELTYVKNSGDTYNAAAKALGVNDSTTTLDVVFGF